MAATTADFRNRLCATAIFSLALSGCASPGFPRPPSLHLPQPVTDLTAIRIADRVELRWTAPSTTTDGLDLTIPTTVEICRETVDSPIPANPAQPPCTPVAKLAGHAGPSTAVDRLPANLLTTQNQHQLVTYRVRVLNPAGRAAPPTAVAIVPAGPVLPPVEAFRAVQVPNGVLLEWSRQPLGTLQPPSRAGVVQVLRTDLTPPPPATPRSQATKTSTGRRKADPEVEIRLQPDPGVSPSDNADHDGMIDQSGLAAGTYTYRAQRTLTLKEGGRTYEILSEPTAPVTIAMRDTFPPSTPQGLVSIPGSRAQTATSAPHPTIDLSWQPNTEADLAGYNVYRIDLSLRSGDGPTRLNASPVIGPAFRDDSVLPGHRYQYTVTAFDRNGNESPPSRPTQDSPDGR